MARYYLSQSFDYKFFNIKQYIMIPSIISRFSDFLSDILEKTGMSAEIAYTIKAVLLIFVLFVLCFLVYWIAKNVILVYVRRIVKKYPNLWSVNLLDKKVFLKLSHLAPVFVIYLLGPALLAEYPVLADKTFLITRIYIIITAMLILFAFLNVVQGVYNAYELSKSRPITGYIQGLKIVTGIIVAILLLSALLDRSPVYMLTGLGAMTAILMLVFKDTILGFVGGVQVTANDMVRIGDWIEMPKYGADGDVIDISLHTVRVQNFDKTITTIPTYALVSDSFKNWRGMLDTKARRIMRSVNIDLKSVKFCDEQMIQKFEKIHHLKDYIKKKKLEIEAHNKKYNIDPSFEVNGRRLTNLGTFRVYIEKYLANHPNINKDMLFMVRQLQSGEHGVALQVYAFADDTNWQNYEAIQSNIFDHIFAVVPFFDLKIFQYPSDLQVNIDMDKQNQKG